jgi:uncharacterized coiled-coil protein SlyX
MLSFRFHIVSLVAVFLALGIGILMGTTVVNDFTIDTLEDQIARARDDVNRSKDEIDQLQNQLRDLEDRDLQYLEESLPLLVADRLTDQPVMILVVDGVDREPIDQLQDALATAGAVFQGTLTLDASLALVDDEEVTEAARLVGRTSTNGPSVRTTLLLRLADALVTQEAPEAVVGPDPAAEEAEAEAEADDEPQDPSLLTQMVSAGFLDYQAPAGASVDGISPAPGTAYVVIGGAEGEVAADTVLYPLLRNLAVNGDTALTVAAEGADPEGVDGEEPEEPAPFVAPVRADEVLAGAVSTVDNLDSVAGQAAVVFALQQLRFGVAGHFGVADGAQRLLPAPVPAS